MEERILLNKDSKPIDKTLKSAFEDVYTYYKTLMDISDSFSKKWTFSKTSGWMLKVYDKKKALFYLIPIKNEFIISLTIREKERKAFLKDNELEKIHDMIKSAKKYSEGFVLRFNVKDYQDFEMPELLIKKLISIRT